MRPRAYYNEIDPFAAQWLRNLVVAGLVSPGDVDERDIRSVQPDDLRGYGRVHFFAGIAGWERALDLAGWSDRPVWTGSCPCQPFSAAGRRAGFADTRHLWPTWFGLIRRCRPAIVFGEQVEAAVRLGWLDAVFADLEGENYTCGAAVLGAHSVGAPHIRQRLWFVAYATGERRYRSEFAGAAGAAPAGRTEAPRRGSAGLRQSAGCGSTVAMADLLGPRLERLDARSLGDERKAAERGGATGLMGYPDRDDPAQERAGHDVFGSQRSPVGRRAIQFAGPGAAGRDGDGDLAERAARLCDGGDAFAPWHSPWSGADWIDCRDGKARPVEPGTFPLAHGIPGRVGRLRAYGNAINPYQGAAFIKACRELMP